MPQVSLDSLYIGMLVHCRPLSALGLRGTEWCPHLSLQVNRPALVSSTKPLAYHMCLSSGSRPVRG